MRVDKACAMLIELVKSKIHRVRITDTQLHYVGSITLDRTLMDAAHIVEYEKVQVVNVNNGQRLDTYVIAAPPGSGQACLNGPAARTAVIGDIVLVIAYATMDPQEARNHKPTIIFPNDKNQVLT